MTKVTLMKGDGIGAEISESLIHVFKALQAPIEFEVVDAGYEEFLKTGEPISETVYDSIERNKIAIKGPTATPIGTGFRSINVSLRKKYDLYANIRPIKSYPNTGGRYQDIDMVIFRENTEGLYIGEEEMVDPINGVAIAKKRITKRGSERIIRAAFEYAKTNNINKVTLVHKANILKITDGLFLDCGRELQKEFPEIQLQEIIIDNMCMQMVMNPHQFKVIVTMNLYGDILSDLAAGLVGGLGMAPGANIGEEIKIFEAVHGTAPDIAGKNLANPTAMLLSGVQMLHAMGLSSYGSKLENAIYNLYQDGRHLTRDLKGSLSTTEFTQKLISFLEV
ncbi:MAG: isocitrate dehydrogenase [Bacillales bacterium]|jgi:isocitrate dehydrogenase (NAD+)|nr:isocitrate dehydrogenase [Bacillales bacterium]